MLIISSRDKPYVSSFSRGLIMAAMHKANVVQVAVSSTFRDPDKQAEVMLDALLKRHDHDIKKWKHSMYRAHGAEVEAIGRNWIERSTSEVKSGLKSGFNPSKALPFSEKSRNETKQNMFKLINQLERKHGKGCVSAHQKACAALNVIDIGLNSIKPHDRVHELIDEFIAMIEISRVGVPKSFLKGNNIKVFSETNSCIHLEISQPLGFQDGSASHFNAV